MPVYPNKTPFKRAMSGVIETDVVGDSLHMNSENLVKSATVVVGKSGAVDYLTTDYASDDACIQAAIDYVNGIGGGSVLIREGTYNIEATLTPKSNIMLTGVGWSTIINRLQTETFHQMIYAPSADNLINFKLYNMLINANENPADYAESSVCLLIYGNHIYIDNVRFEETVKTLTINAGEDFSATNISIETIHQTLSDGICFSDCTGGIISKCYIKSYDDCIVLNGSSNINVDNIICADSGGLNPGIKLRGSRTDKHTHDININNITMYNRNWGLHIWCSTEVAQIYNINISNVIMNIITETGILLKNDLSASNPDLIHDITFDNIRIDTTPNGIYIHDLACKDIKFNNINIKNNSSYGMRIEGGKRISFSSCEVDNATAKGIWIEGSNIEDISFNNLICKNNNGDGLYAVSADGSNLHIYNSHFFGNGRDGLRVGLNSVILDSYIHDNTEHGLRSGSNTTILKNCEFENNTTGNIDIPTGGSKLIINNVGYNPVGNFTPPAIPATTVNYTNAYGYPCQVQVHGGTVTEIDIDDIATGLTSGIFMIPPGGTINITYSAAPSWRWWGL